MSEIVDVTTLRSWLIRFAGDVEEHAAQLTELDSAIGDADHGSNLTRGLKAVVSVLADDATPPSIGPMLKQSGMALVSSVGGASGPLYGTFFLRMATSAGECDAIGPDSLAAAFRAGLEGVLARGKAVAGDKTMLDALIPAVETLETALGEGRPFGEALRASADAAEAGRDATTPMLARKGRASYLGERSVGHQDPGATSTALLFRAAANTMIDGEDNQ
ncbi:dihydroxyacetone kinase subunit DhaL [Kineosporia sp. NBRC 101731]|uniref:dihydroxyacetone kinase subunit DhaL n=1 Tax=Kineosporia sp. NBRC 101731 TaxID=3032199 RepID=UPI0024A1FEDC|nr:dihydroxyacetone kinase subunit DhaL [Kineosporia sp. NBRC 101731]GLY30023.1 dihydroxyacetone kinase subunit L [Kineosporia sp. NBRC 101731]